MIVFPGHSSYSLNQMRLNFGEPLAYKLVQRILFRGYSTHNFDRVITLSNCSDMTSFRRTFQDYSFHRIRLKLGEELDH